MANPNTPRGLVPVRSLSGGYFNGMGNIYYFPASDANNIFVGDPVVVSGISDANGVPGVTIATAGSSNYITGSFMGFIPGGGPILPELAVLRDSPVYRPASVAGYGLISDDPNQLYEIQEDSVGGALTAAAASDNANLVAGAGSTITAASGWQLQSSSVATTNTLQLRILRGQQRVDNTIGVNFKWLVKINLHSISSTTGV
jgi:hypothetical protein